MAYKIKKFLVPLKKTIFFINIF